MRKYIPIVSDKMSKNSENDIVRLSSSARGLLSSVKDDKVELWSKTEGRSIVLPVKQAYKHDINNVKGNSRVKLRDVIFVSSNVAAMLGSDKSVWADKKPRKCAIGSDPEMIAVDNNGTIIRASNVVNFNGKIGSDGPALELRPSPGETAQEHINNIHDLVLELKQRYLPMFNKYANSDVSFLCVPYIENADRSFTAGGHIHLGLSSYLSNNVIVRLDNNEIVQETIDHVLNNCLALVVQRIEGERGLDRRDFYGYPGEFRTTNNRLEYRTLSSVWLAYPDLAEIVLTLAHEVTIEISTRMLDYFKTSSHPNTNDFESLANELVGMELYSRDDLDSFLISGGVTRNDIEGHPLQVFEKIITDKNVDKLMNIASNVNINNLCYDIIQNWSNNASITNTF